MSWHDTSGRDDSGAAIETVAHWLEADIWTIARALSSLNPRRLRPGDASTLRDVRTSKSEPGRPVDLDEWNVVVTDILPVALRHRPGLVEVWRCRVEWDGTSHRILQLVDEPITIDAHEGSGAQRAKRLLKAIAMQRTKQARRSTVCTWCGQPMVKGERFSTYCCYGCASTMRGVAF